MEVGVLIRTINAGDSLLETLRVLGSDLLADREAAEWDRYVTSADTWVDAINGITEESTAIWAADGSYVADPSERLHRLIEELASTPALATLAVVEGVCRGAGSAFFAWSSGIVTISRGMVLPLPSRRLDGWETTPNPATTHQGLLDRRAGFVLWESDWDLELDFTFRDRLDLLCAIPTVDEDGIVRFSLPKMATVHPFKGHEMAEPDELANGRFFGVHPSTVPADRSAQSNLAQVLKSLEVVGSQATVAVLPEFCMHLPDLLDGTRGSPESPLPPIVISGSAHCERDGRKFNRSVTYMDGVPVLDVTKAVPFVYRVRDAAGTVHEYLEDIAPGPRQIKIAAGTNTRLAVAICSDLNSTDFVSTLVASGVNLFFAPAWTPKIGTFWGVIGELAALSQCVVLVANTPGHPSRLGDTFWALSVVPRERCVPQDHEPDGGDVSAGILNPNELPESADYWTWV